jgi:hypothetical protein
MQVRTNKFNAQKAYSNLCEREFDSKAERSRGEELRMMELAGKITCLEYQVPVVLSEHPSVKLILDFRYLEHYKTIWEDVKGMMTPAARVKIAWAWQRYHIKVNITHSGERK